MSEKSKVRRQAKRQRMFSGQQGHAAQNGGGTEGASPTSGSDRHPAVPDRDSFAELFMDRCRKHDTSLTVEYDREQFAVKDEAKGVSMSLSNLFADYCSASEEHRHDVLATYVLAFIEMCTKVPEVPSSFSEAKARLFPVISNRWTNDIKRLENSQDGSAVHLSRQLSENLATMIAYDNITTVVYLTTDILGSWGVSEDEVYAAAAENMRKLMADRIRSGQALPLDEFLSRNGLKAPDLAGAFRPFKDVSRQPAANDAPSGRFVTGVSLSGLGFGRIASHPDPFAAPGDDWYSSSRILVEDWIRFLPVRGDPVAMVTHRGDLFVTGADDPESLRGMAELATSTNGRAHSVSNIPVRLTPEGWRTWLPPQGHPAHDAFMRLHAEEMATVYLQQQYVLLRLPGRRGFVASCFSPGRESTCVGTAAVWTKDTNPLLPKVDWVAFGIVDPANVELVHLSPSVPWDDVQSIVGHRMSLTEFSPPRYRATGFPSEEELARLYEVGRRAGFPEL